jgi:hypothetical protein
MARKGRVGKRLEDGAKKVGWFTWLKPIVDSALVTNVYLKKVGDRTSEDKQLIKLLDPIYNACNRKKGVRARGLIVEKIFNVNLPIVSAGYDQMKKNKSIGRTESYNNLKKYLTRHTTGLSRSEVKSLLMTIDDLKMFRGPKEAALNKLGKLLLDVGPTTAYKIHSKFNKKHAL